MSPSSASKNAVVRTFFATVGPVQSQLRELLNPTAASEDTRPVVFCAPNHQLDVLPAAMHARAWVYLNRSDDSDPLLLIAAVSRRSAVYLVLNLNERATLSALRNALSQGRLDMLTPCHGRMFVHQFRFSESQSAYLSRAIKEHLEMGLLMRPNWMRALDKNALDLPAVCEQFHAAVADCDEHTCIVVRGAYEDHLRGLDLALRARVNTRLHPH